MCNYCDKCALLQGYDINNVCMCRKEKKKLLCFIRVVVAISPDSFSSHCIDGCLTIMSKVKTAISGRSMINLLSTLQIL